MDDLRDIISGLVARHGGTQAQAAEAAGFTAATLSRWQSGHRIPSAAALAALLDRLGATDSERDRAASALLNAAKASASDAA